MEKKGILTESRLQHTLAAPVEVSGVGLHSGCDVTVRLEPAPPDTGIVFRRVDLRNFEIEAHRRYVSRVVLATTLMKHGVMLSTVEHLLSALYGLQVDNVYVAIDSLEVPILDGSAQVFVQLIDRVGRRAQSPPRTFLKVENEVVVRQADKFIKIKPASRFEISYRIDFEHPAIGRQHFEGEITPAFYAREIALARTFGFLSEVEQLRRSNLIRGGSLDNAVVLDDSGIMNGNLRVPDEFVRHKVLDLIGDIALCGYPLLGRIEAYKAGHALHTQLATELTRQSSAFRLVSEAGDRLAPA